MSTTTPVNVSSKRKSTDSIVYNEKSAAFTTDLASDLTPYLRGLSLDETRADDNEGNPISVNSLENWEESLLSDSKNVLAQSAFAKNAITDIIGVSDVSTHVLNQYLFNVEVDVIGSPSFFNNQKSSGRCWIFASLNVLRAHVIRNYNLDPSKFQLSQSYIYFYDKLEKANFYLENIIDTADEKSDAYLVRYLNSAPVNDGGQWDMVVNLVTKYGVIPQELFPDSAQAQNSSRLNYIVTEKLREYGLILRKLIEDGKSKESVAVIKKSMVKQVYNIIALSLGTPPKPTDEFTWEFIDKSGKYQSFKTTALDFYLKHVRFDAAKHFSIIHDPRNDYDTLYTVDRLNNISDGKPIEYVNKTLPDIKKIAIKMLQANEPIFFGSDVGKFSDSQSGILDVHSYDYNLGFGTDLNLTKAERLRVGSSQMTHAMVITGVHLNPSGVPLRWKIENSWGDSVGEKGYFLMTDAWFDEYVFQIVTNKAFVDKKTYEIWKSKDFTVLPFEDPMGALA